MRHLYKFKKSEIAIVKWYNEQIKIARAEKDGKRVLQLEKEIRAIGMDIRKEVLKRE
ncbi:hypothetical protein AB3M91_20305 [Solibacillus isronensis]